MREVAVQLEERRSQEFRRFMLISLGLHLAAALALLITPSGPTVAPPLGVRVQLVPPPASAPAKPAPKPAPARPKPPPPKPKPKPPKPAPVVLPTEPTTPKPEPPKPEVPKPEPPKPEIPKPELTPPPKPPEPIAETPPPEEEYVDVMDQLRAELGEETPDAPPPTQVAQTGPIGSPDGAPVSAEVAAWLRSVKAHVRRNWVVPPAFEMQSLVTSIEVDLDAAGNVRGEPSVEARSGNPWYDENVVRSIQKSSPLPAPPKPGVWTFVFQSDRD